MNAPGGWNRVALPLALSLGGHAALVVVCLWAPLLAEPVREGKAVGAGSAAPGSLRFVRLAQATPQPVRPSLPSDGPWINAPRLERAPVLPAVKGGAPGLVGQSPAHKEGPERGGAGQGSGSGLLAVGPQARRVVYLIDCSVSMGLFGAFERARAEVLASARRLPAEASFQVLAYTRTASPLIGRPLELLPATPDTLDQVAEALQERSPSGQTDHVAAVRTALTYRPDLLFLLTDADDLGPVAARELGWMKTGLTAVHVIELSGGQGPEGPLADLAGRTGGSYRRVRPE